jgi:hypothetical protein
VRLNKSWRHAAANNHVNKVIDAGLIQTDYNLLYVKKEEVA